MTPIPFILLALHFASSAVAQTPHALPFYRDGMIVRTVIGPAGDDGYRLISLGLYSEKDASGTIFHKIGIQDVTDSGNIYGQNFSLCDGPERRLFPLKTGGRIYVLTVTGCGSNIKFGRPGNEDQIQTSRDKLFILRAQNALDHGSRVQMGSTQFAVVFQGGSESPGLVFFRADIQSSIDRNDIANIRPTFFVQTMEIGPGGDWQNKSGPLPIGTWEDRSFELVWDTWLSQWRVHEVGS